MRLAWVSRTLYEAMRDDAREQLAQAALAYKELLTKYHQLKLQGATLVEPVVHHQRSTIDSVEQAIQAACIGRPELIPIMRRQAMREKNAGLPEREITLRIQHGVRPAAMGHDDDPSSESQATAS